MWMTTVAILVPAVVVWFVAGRMWHWRLPGERWAELIVAIGAAFLGRALLLPLTPDLVPTLWVGVIGATVGAAAGLYAIRAVATPPFGVATLGCCSGPAADGEVAALLRANARTSTTPGPPYVYPYVLPIRRGGAAVWVWDNACPAGTKVTIRFKKGSPFPSDVYTGEAPRAVVAAPLVHTGDFEYGLEMVEPDGTTCKSDPIIRGRA